MGEDRSFPKQARLTRRSEYLIVQRDGHRRHTAHFVVIRTPARGARSRLGVTVSKRVGNSVVRNRVKRLLRETFRHRQASIRPATDIVVIAKPGAETLTHAHAAAEFAKALELRADT